MAHHTHSECSACRVPFSCCNADACREAANFAWIFFGIDTKPDFTKAVPFLSETGCTLPPHLRPQCTVYTCDIHAFGFKRDYNPKWNKRYWQLREDINNHLAKFDDELPPMTQDD